MITFKKSDCEFLRYQAKQKFDKVRGTWVDAGRWALPHRVRWMLSQEEGARNNQHIVDSTHILALRSYVAGFLEGNTSASRPWYRIGTGSPDINSVPENYAWLDRFTRRTLQVLAGSNFYDSAGAFYYDYGTFNTGAHYIEEMDDKQLFFHTLMPGAYFAINNAYGDAVVLVREFSLNVKAIVDTYGKKNKSGQRDWSNISSGVRKMYEDGNYTFMIDVVHVIKENHDFDPSQPQVLLNRPWIQYTYEVGGNSGHAYAQGQELGFQGPEERDKDKFLKLSANKRKPFIVGKSTQSFEYGEKGPTTDALGLIKSLNKKAIGKDQALEQMLRPPMQGPASLKKSYITTASNSYVPLDPTSLAQKGMQPIYQTNPAIAPLLQDVSDLRQQVEKLYYADYLLFLSSNPKTRTATETDAIVREQQIVIGPNLQSLNWTYNVPVVEFVMDYVLFEDPIMQEYPVPKGLEGSFLKPEFVSVFAQAQKAADLPAVDRYMAMIMNVGQVNPAIFDKANLDKLADLYEDRLFLPAGLNNPQSKVEAMREQARAQMERQKMLNETLPAVAGAAKDIGMKVN